MEKITKTQKDVMAVLQKNEIIHCTSGFNAKCFYSSDVKKVLRWSTIFALEEKGLIVRGERTINLTEKGKTWKKHEKIKVL